jgi:hypothetical protein
MRRIWVGIGIGIGIGIGVGLAEAKKEPPAGSVAFIRDRAVWKAPLAAPDQAVKLVDLAVAPALVRGMAAAGDGSALLVDLGGNAAWIDLSAEPAAAPVFLPCGAGRLAQDGGRVLCAARAGKGAVAYRMRPRLGSAPLARLSPDRTALGGGDRLVTEVDGTLRSAPGSAVVAPHAPLDRLSVSPDGARAVGRYQDGDADSLFGFRLDGRGARRKLISGVPVAWSADSVWLAVDTEEAACVLRAVGGEYKCWDDYRSLAVDAGGTHALLAVPGERSIDVYLVRIAGVRPDKPSRILEGVLAATLVP